MQVGRVDEHIAATDLEQLQSNREFLALPRFCVEVLQSSKEEVDAVKPQVCVWFDEFFQSYANFKRMYVLLSFDDFFSTCLEMWNNMYLHEKLEICIILERKKLVKLSWLFKITAIMWPGLGMGPPEMVRWQYCWNKPDFRWKINLADHVKG